METKEKVEKKVQVFDIQTTMQKLLERIQPVQSQIAELDQKRLALTAEILKEPPATKKGKSDNVP